MNNLSILIVDDDSMILMLHEHVLRKAKMINGKSALHAYDGQEALEVIEKNDHPETTFLVLLDINMPVMDGWEFLDALEISRFKSDVYVSIVTSSLDYSDKNKADEYNRVLSYIEKPLNLQSLQELKEKSVLARFFK